MANREAPTKYKIPAPTSEAYFPPLNPNAIPKAEVIKRAGEENLVCAFEYGSHITGDASPTSIYDVMIIVADTKKFHEENIQSHKTDYGNPKSAKWHAFLNTFGFNFYQTQFEDHENTKHAAKIAVISEKDFKRGCNGAFIHEKGDEQQGAFGLYVAGRMQKVALSPLYMKKEKGEEINSAINRARIDGVWFALGLLEDKFTYEELLKMYVSLSYQADVRVEKRGKVEALIEKSSDDYSQMLTPIIEEFINSGLITKEENRFEKIQSLTRNEAMKRIQQLRLINFLTNYIKNPLTSPLNRAVLYALAKINRVRDSNKREKQ